MKGQILYDFTYVEISTVVRFPETESRMMVDETGGREIGGCLTSHGVSISQDEKALEAVVQCECI